MGMCIFAMTKIKVNNEWRNATPFVKVNGVWRQATAYTKVDGVWRHYEEDTPPEPIHPNLLLEPSTDIRWWTSDDEYPDPVTNWYTWTEYSLTHYRIEVTPTSNAQWLYYFPLVQVEQNTNYIFSAYVKDIALQGANSYIDFYLQRGDNTDRIVTLTLNNSHKGKHIQVVGNSLTQTLMTPTIDMEVYVQAGFTYVLELEDLYFGKA